MPVGCTNTSIRRTANCYLYSYCFRISGRSFRDTNCGIAIGGILLHTRSNQLGRFRQQNREAQQLQQMSNALEPIEDAVLELRAGLDALRLACNSKSHDNGNQPDDRRTMSDQGWPDTVRRLNQPACRQSQPQKTPSRCPARSSCATTTPCWSA